MDPLGTKKWTFFFQMVFWGILVLDNPRHCRGITCCSKTFSNHCPHRNSCCISPSILYCIPLSCFQSHFGMCFSHESSRKKTPPKTTHDGAVLGMIFLLVISLFLGIPIIMPYGLLTSFERAVSTESFTTRNKVFQNFVHVIADAPSIDSVHPHPIG